MELYFKLEIIKNIIGLTLMAIVFIIWIIYIITECLKLKKK